MIKSSPRLLLLISFVAGFAIMAMEISASRLLAPYFGTSLFVWTNIIGVVLIALSLGYYLGGKLADKKPQINILLKLILLAGILLLVIPMVIKPLTSFVDLGISNLQTASVVIFISSLIVTVILFAIPLFILGMVSPFIIKLYSLLEKENIGQMAGTIFAVSTIGSILGTFLPTLYFIPVLGTKATINIFAMVLIVLGSLGFINIKFRLGSILLFLFLAFYSAQLGIKDNADLIFEDESAYQYISVFQNNQGDRFLVYNEGGGVQSVKRHGSILTGNYFDNINLLPYLIETNSQKRVLVIGLAGGTIASQLNYFFQDEIIIDGVEIDQKVINAGEEYFGLDSSKVNIYNQDGRMFLRNSVSEDKYDLVIVDAYQKELYIPWTLTTQEFWTLIKDRLTDNGLITINVNSIVRQSDLLNSISNTIASVFDHTYLTSLSDNSWNYLITASQTELDFNSISNKTVNPELSDLTLVMIEKTEKINYSDKLITLTDDKAPVEFMTESMAFSYIKDSLKN
ncbi:MAG: hypothetical protein CMI53_00970 [Parcubacteria group bacterium]|nr:hypothetical protein [Parcubacteria group bacterium]|tara:strand:- start:10257 stop:11795 length:1539 start_codon:yes stop_codon:yes gene_type:complete